MGPNSELPENKNNDISSGRLPRKLKFTIGATAIDIASEYNYLGIVCSTSGSLKSGKTLA